MHSHRLIHTMLIPVLLLTAAATLISACANVQPPLTLTEQAYRSTAEKQRDPYRHPQQTLRFFEITRQDTVVEIWPGRGWYTQILAPLVKQQGHFIAAHWPEDSKVDFFRRMRRSFDDKFLHNPARYGEIKITELEPPEYLQLADDNSADKVLTFRNVHNWMRNRQEQAVFNAAFAALKPGGLFGVVEHRAPASFSRQQMIDSGYVSEAYIKKLAKNAGFEFIAAAEINANPKDTKDHPKGVWTLPPSWRLGDKNREKYRAIGESDRMTLKFRKPM